MAADSFVAQALVAHRTAVRQRFGVILASLCPYSVVSGPKRPSDDRDDDAQRRIRQLEDQVMALNEKVALLTDLVDLLRPPFNSALFQRVLPLMRTVPMFELDRLYHTGNHDIIAVFPQIYLERAKQISSALGALSTPFDRGRYRQLLTGHWRPEVRIDSGMFAQNDTFIALSIEESDDNVAVETPSFTDEPDDDGGMMRPITITLYKMVFAPTAQRVHKWDVVQTSVFRGTCIARYNIEFTIASVSPLGDGVVIHRRQILAHFGGFAVRFYWSNFDTIIDLGRTDDWTATAVHVDGNQTVRFALEGDFPAEEELRENGRMSVVTKKLFFGYDLNWSIISRETQIYLSPQNTDEILLVLKNDYDEIGKKKFEYDKDHRRLFIRTHPWYKQFLSVVDGSMRLISHSSLASPGIAIVDEFTFDGRQVLRTANASYQIVLLNGSFDLDDSRMFSSRGNFSFEPRTSTFRVHELLPL